MGQLKTLECTFCLCRMCTTLSKLAGGTLQFDQHQFCVEATVEIGLDIFAARSCMVYQKKSTFQKFQVLDISGCFRILQTVSDHDGHFGLFRTILDRRNNQFNRKVTRKTSISTSVRNCGFVVCCFAIVHLCNCAILHDLMQFSGIALVQICVRVVYIGLCQNAWQSLCPFPLSDTISLFIFKCYSTRACLLHGWFCFSAQFFQFTSTSTEEVLRIRRGFG